MVILRSQAQVEDLREADEYEIGRHDPAEQAREDQDEDTGAERDEASGVEGQRDLVGLGRNRV
jgi:rhodanese-related sulfurtransferase